MGLLACHKRGKFFMLDGRHNQTVSEPTSPFFLSCDGPTKRRRAWFVSSHNLYTPACWPVLTCQPSTLSSPPGWGPGHYRLSALKQTTNSDGFLALPDTKKGCQVATRLMTVSAVPSPAGGAGWGLPGKTLEPAACQQLPVQTNGPTCPAPAGK